MEGRLKAHKRSFVANRWGLWNRSAQNVGDTLDWTTWLMLGGRGSGKTRAGAEWVRSMALGDPLVTTRAVGRIALVGETYADARAVMVEGESGLLSVCPGAERPVWKPSLRQLEFPNGAVAQLFSSEDADALRGPQFGAAWSDELAKWQNGRETWDMLQFGLRLGDFPRQVVTTTPRPLRLLREILNDPRTRTTRMGTQDNAAHLAPGFLDRVVSHYRGTRLGRQELDGEIIEDRADALWSRDGIDALRRSSAPELQRVVVAVDPPITGKVSSDACGIVVAGVDAEGRAYVIHDGSMNAVSPERWSRRAVELYERYDADRIVVETNQGGDMAEAVIRGADPTVAVRQVKATRGKYLRAEPVAHLYERGLVHHVGPLGPLEDEMCDFALSGLSSGRSPDRLDALVWALTDLMLTNHAAPRARSL